MDCPLRSSEFESIFHADLPRPILVESHAKRETVQQVAPERGPVVKSEIVALALVKQRLGELAAILKRESLAKGLGHRYTELFERVVFERKEIEAKLGGELGRVIID